MSTATMATAGIVLAALMAASVPDTADAHSYLLLPISRQYSRSKAFHEE